MAEVALEQAGDLLRVLVGLRCRREDREPRRKHLFPVDPDLPVGSVRTAARTLSRSSAIRGVRVMTISRAATGDRLLSTQRLPEGVLEAAAR
jgi:hypothetical protein